MITERSKAMGVALDIATVMVAGCIAAGAFGGLALIAFWLQDVLVHPEGPITLPFPVLLVSISMFFSGVFVALCIRGRISLWILPTVAVSYLAVAIPEWRHLRFWLQPSAGMLAVPWIGILSGAGLACWMGWRNSFHELVVRSGLNAALRFVQLVVLLVGGGGVFALFALHSPEAWRPFPIAASAYCAAGFLCLVGMLIAAKRL